MGKIRKKDYRQNRDYDFEDDYFGTNKHHRWLKHSDDDYQLGHDTSLKSNRISKNSDNRFFCPEIGREKFRYETKEKALLACKYSSNKQRPYYCKACCAWHTTRMSKGKYYGLKASES